VVFDPGDGEKMWVIGGQVSGGKDDDVWYSSDGVTWSQATAAAAFPVVAAHTSVVHDGKMWMIAGWMNGETNEVWSSLDGATWVQATPAAAFGARSQHTSVVFDNKMWVIAGGENGVYNDVWSSSDGVTWNQATANASFGIRYKHTSVVHDNKMWVIGGRDDSWNILDDAYYSSDGITWTRSASISAFIPSVSSSSETAKIEHTSVVHEVNGTNKMYVIAGKNTWPTPDSWVTYNDMWYSANGVSWTKATVSSSFPSKESHSSVVFNDKIWVIGGSGTSVYNNDVYYSPKP